MKARRNTACRSEKVSVVAALVVGLAAPASAQESGWEAFGRGQFAEASAWVSETLAQQPDHQRARHLRILTSFLSGRFEDALAQYLLLPAGYSGRDEALTLVILNAYLHLDRYQEAAAFAQAMALPEPERVWLDARAARPPTVRLDCTTVAPFAADNFLGELMPAVEVELNGTPLVAHLDTGGAFITMSPSRAQELGIQVREVGTGVANNQATSVSRGLADSLTIGDAELTNVQVSTVESLTGQLESLVILGTRILSSFLTTWDNEQGRLILTPRDDVTARSRHLAEHTGGVEGTDLYLHGDHFLWVNGIVGGHWRADVPGHRTGDARPARQPASGGHPAGCVGELGRGVRRRVHRIRHSKHRPSEPPREFLQRVSGRPQSREPRRHHPGRADLARLFQALRVDDGLRRAQALPPSCHAGRSGRVG